MLFFLEKYLNLCSKSQRFFSIGSFVKYVSLNDRLSDSVHLVMIKIGVACICCLQLVMCCRGGLFFKFYSKII